MSDPKTPAPAPAKLSGLQQVAVEGTNLLHELGDFFSAKVAELEGEALVIAKKVAPSVETIAENAIEYIEGGLTKLGQFAWDAVVAEGEAVIEGKDKFSTATQSVIQMVEAEGLSVGKATAGMAVQGAFKVLEGLAASL